MEFLVKTIFILSLVFISCVTSLGRAAVVDEKKKICESSQEFIDTVEYLRKQKDFVIPEMEIVKVALKVSENCTDASAKFKKMLTTLVKTGVNFDHALKFSILYSKETREAVDAFLALYEGLVLEKKFNLPFYQAFETAKAFAESSRSTNTGQLKKDFLGFLGFCMGEDNGAYLTMDMCRQLSFKYIKLHAIYERGVFEDFKNLFLFLRDKRQTGLPISTALQLTQTTLEFGPGSRRNFIAAYNYGLNDLSMKPEQALRLAVKMASQSKPKAEDDKK
jgi:hypothetical protein